MTPRNPDRATDGAAAAVCARLLDRRMPPWARAAVDLAGERDDTGRYVYPIVVVTVPRQSAKTTTALDAAIGRGMAHPDYRSAYTAQTGHVVTRRMGDRMDALALVPMLEPRLRLRRSQGTERVTVRATRSYLLAFPPKDGALRSEALDLVIVDEAQEHDDDPLGRALDATILPTFTTRPRRQLWVLGTAPDRPGTMLERYVTMARAGVPGVALVDYGIGDDDDPADEAVWQRVHPGLAAGLTDLDYLRQQHAHDPEAFAREHLNRYPEPGAAAGAAIRGDAWRAAAALEDEARRLDVARPRAGGLALAVSIDGERAALASAYRLEDARVLVKVLDERPGTGWVVQAARALSRQLRLPVTVDAFGPAGPVVDDLRRAGVHTDVCTTGFYTTACVGFLSDVVADPPRLVHLAQPVLDAAALTAGRRMLDRGTWAWSRRAGDVHALEAVSLAAHAVRTAAPRPRVR